MTTSSPPKQLNLFEEQDREDLIKRVSERDSLYNVSFNSTVLHHPNVPLAESVTHAPLEYITAGMLREFEHQAIQLNMPLHCRLLSELDRLRREHRDMERKLNGRWAFIRLSTAVLTTIVSWMLVIWGALVLWSHV